MREFRPGKTKETKNPWICLVYLVGSGESSASPRLLLRRTHKSHAFAQFDDGCSGGCLADAWNGDEDFEAPGERAQPTIELADQAFGLAGAQRIEERGAFVARRQMAAHEL